MIVFYLGTVEDSFIRHSNAKFSTPDQDTDSFADGNCAKDHSSGWWFVSCFRVSLNGKHAQHNSSFSWKGLIKGDNNFHPLKSSSMKTRSVSSKCNFGDSVTR